MATFHGDATWGHYMATTYNFVYAKYSTDVHACVKQQVLQYRLPDAPTLLPYNRDSLMLSVYVDMISRLNYILSTEQLHVTTASTQATILRILSGGG